MNNTTKTETKQCNKCGRTLPVDVNHFHRHKECKGGFRNTCKECRGSKFGVHQINRVSEARKGHRFCGKCRKELPLDKVHFYRSKNTKHGFGTWCKKCWGAKEYGVSRINVLEESKEGFKFCSICEHQKPYKDFSKCADSSDGFKSSCKECLKEKQKAYSSRPDVKKHKAEYGKRYRKIYYATEKGKTVNKRNIQKRRSRKKETIYNYSLDEWTKTLRAFNHKCAYCGDDKKELHQEHIIPMSKGGYYTKQNIVPACYFCNGSKHNHDLFEWYPKQLYYSEKRMNKILKWSGVDKKSNTQQLSIL